MDLDFWEERTDTRADLECTEVMLTFEEDKDASVVTDVAMEEADEVASEEFVIDKEEEDADTERWCSRCGEDSGELLFKFCFELFFNRK